YTPAAGAVLNGGNGQTLSVTFTPSDGSIYNSVSKTVTLNVLRAPQTITFGTLPPHVVGDAPFTVPHSSSSGLTGSLASSDTGVATVSGNTLTIVGAGTTTLTASQPGDGNYRPATPVSVDYTITKTTPVLTWANPADIVYGTPLSGTQLNATANVS